MQLTLSVDEAVIERARATAAASGKTLEEFLREYLEQVAMTPDADWSQELHRLSKQGSGRLQGWRLDRDALHERS
jgi:uncharacterized protein DUF6364